MIINYSYYYFKRMNPQRKLIQIFKTFVEKSLVPQLRKIDGQLYEWNKFSSMLTSQAINYEELQAYVDSISQLGQTGINSFEKKDQIPMFKKKKEETNELQPNDSGTGSGFNPSKTFGGERARMMFPLKNDMDDFTEKDKFGGGGSFNFNANKDDYQKKQSFVNPQTILPGLQRLCKAFVQNQQRIENIVNSPSFGGGKFY